MVRTILVVDEDAAAVGEFVTALGRAGHAAMGAQTFRDASRILSTSEPSLLIANIHLGPYNGLHLLLRGRAEYPEMNAIIIGPADAATEREARRLGAAAYLAQPITAENVLVEVMKLAPRSAQDGVWHDDAPAPAMAPLSTWMPA